MSIMSRMLSIAAEVAKDSANPIEVVDFSFEVFNSEQEYPLVEYSEVIEIDQDFSLVMFNSEQEYPLVEYSEVVEPITEAVTELVEPITEPMTELVEPMTEASMTELVELLTEAEAMTELAEPVEVEAMTEAEPELEAVEVMTVSDGGKYWKVAFGGFINVPKRLLAKNFLKCMLKIGTGKREAMALKLINNETLFLKRVAECK